MRNYIRIMPSSRLEPYVVKWEYDLFGAEERRALSVARIAIVEILIS